LPGSEDQLLKSGVTVEKLLLANFAKIKSRQDAPQSIYSGRLDIFYLPNFGCLGRRVSFSTATGVSTSLRLCFAFLKVDECNRDVTPTHGSCTYSMSICPTFASFLKTRAFEEKTIRSLRADSHSGCATKRVAPWSSSAINAFAAPLDNDLETGRTLICKLLPVVAPQFRSKLTYFH